MQILSQKSSSILQNQIHSAVSSFVDELLRDGF
jgi:hypothetical protein